MAKTTVTYSLYGNMGVAYDFHCLKTRIPQEKLDEWIEHYKKTWRHVEVRRENENNY